jgi:chromosome segregation ATPase
MPANIVISFILKHWKTIGIAIVFAILLGKIGVQNHEISNRNNTIAEKQNQIVALGLEIDKSNQAVLNLNAVINNKQTLLNNLAQQNTRSVKDLKSKLEQKSNENLDLNRKIDSLDACNSELADIKKQLSDTEQMYREGGGQ